MKKFFSHIYKIIINNWEFYIKFFFAFFIAKLALLLVPILLSNAIGVKEYSLFEYGLSWGLILSVLLGLGFNYSFTYYNLVRKVSLYNRTVYFHGLIISLLVILFTALFLVDLLHINIYISILMGIALTGQGIIANTFLTQGKPDKGTLFQSGLYVVSGIAGGLFILFKLNDFLNLLITALLFYIFFSLAINYKFYKSTQDVNLIEGYRTFFNFGHRPLLFILLYMWMFHSWKIYIEHFLGMEMVGIYSIYYRFASLVIVFEKIIEELFFKQIFQKPLREIDKYYSVFLGLILMASLFIGLVIKMYFFEYFVLIKETINIYPTLIWTFAISMVFWSSITLSQKVLLREKISIKII